MQQPIIIIALFCTMVFLSRYIILFNLCFFKKKLNRKKFLTFLKDRNFNYNMKIIFLRLIYSLYILLPLYFTSNFIECILYMILFTILYFIIVMDLYNQNFGIDDRLIIAGIIVSLAIAIYNNHILSSLFGILIAFSINIIIYKITYYFYQDEVYGLGDVFLSSLIGSIVCMQYFSVFLCSLISTLPVSIYFLVKGNFNQKIPLSLFYIFPCIIYKFLN